MARRIDETLGEGEAGVLIADDSRRLTLPEDIRVITACPFQPKDYLNSWLATLRLKDRKEQTSDKGNSEKRSGENPGTE